MVILLSSMRITFKLNGVALLSVSLLFHLHLSKPIANKRLLTIRETRAQTWFHYYSLEIQAKVHVPQMRLHVGTTSPYQIRPICSSAALACEYSQNAHGSHVTFRLSTVTKRLFCPTNTQCECESNIVVKLRESLRSKDRVGANHTGWKC